MKYKFNVTTVLLSSEWHQEYFDRLQNDGWELVNMAPGALSDLHYCYWRKPIEPKEPA